MRVSSGRRATPNVLSGSRATYPAASTSSIVRSIGVVSGFSFGLGVGLGVGLAAGGFAAGGLSSAGALGSRLGVRGPGFVAVAASERYTTLRSPIPHADRKRAGTLIEYDAGGPNFSSSPARRLFQPSQTAL